MVLKTANRFKWVNVVNEMQAVYEKDQPGLLIDILRDFYDSLAALYKSKMEYFTPHRHHFIALVTEMR